MNIQPGSSPSVHENPTKAAASATDNIVDSANTMDKTPATSAKQQNHSDPSCPPDAGTTAAQVAAAIVAASGDPAPGATSSQSVAASDITQQQNNTTQQQNNRGNLNHPSANLPSISEDSDFKLVGLNLSVCNQKLDIVDFIFLVLNVIKPNSHILNHQAQHTSTITRDDLIKQLLTPAEAYKLYKSFFGVTDDITRDGTGHKLMGRRHAGFYVYTTQSYKDIKDGLFALVGGRNKMMEFQWYLKPYYDTEPCQKIIALLCGKNTEYGYLKGYADRIKASLLEQDPQAQFKLSITPHNDKTSTGQKIRAYGVQIGRSQAKDLERAMRNYPEKHFKGLHVRYKSDKPDRESYDETLSNISQLSNTYTGISVEGLSLQGSYKLQQDLTNHAHLQFNYPMDVEATHLATKFGRCMVTCPAKHYKEVKDTIQSLFDGIPREQYSNSSYPDGPSIFVRPAAPRSVATTSVPDPYGNLSVLLDDNDSVNTSPTFKDRRTQAYNDLPQLGNINMDMIKEITIQANAAGAMSYLAAATGVPEDQSLGDTSLASQISALTAENSLLKDSLSEAGHTIKTLQTKLEEHAKHTEEAVQAATEEHNKKLQATEAKVETLQLQCKKLHTTLVQKEASHKQYVQHMQTLYEQQEQKYENQLQSVQDTIKNDREEAEKRRREDKAQADQSISALQQQFLLFQQQIQSQMSSSPPSSSPSSSSKRSRITSPSRTNQESGLISSDIAMNDAHRASEAAEDDDMEEFDESDIFAADTIAPPLADRPDPSYEAPARQMSQLQLDAALKNNEKLA